MRAQKILRSAQRGQGEGAYVGENLLDVTTAPASRKQVMRETALAAPETCSMTALVVTPCQQPELLGTACLGIV